MDERLNLWNKLGLLTLLLLSFHVNPAISQTPSLEDMTYDWSTFLLLVIPVLIILVVLVLCVTGVFMFCLSTLTMNFDQDFFFGQSVGTQTHPETKKSIPNSQLCPDKDCLNHRQSLPVIETVKFVVEEVDSPSKSAEDCDVADRTGTGLKQEADLEQNERQSVSEVQGIRKLQQVEAGSCLGD